MSTLIMSLNVVLGILREIIQAKEINGIKIEKDYWRCSL